MEETKTSQKKIAIIQIRGLVGARQEMKDTMKMLNLERKNNCVIVPSNQNYMGMIQKVKDYITYGEISPDTEKKLEKRKKIKKTYLLMPPRKGFERGGIKKPFTKGGALGYRGEKINELISRMV